MYKYLLVISLFTFALSLPGAIGQEKSDNEQEPAHLGKEAEDEKGPKTEEKGRHKGDESEETSSDIAAKSTAEERDFLKLAEPETKKKKEPKTRPYGSYWMSTYGGRVEKEERDEYVEDRVRPYLSPYDAPGESPKPKKLKISPLTPPPLAEFIEVDFAKFASGSYVSEYADEFVKIRCKFASLAPEGMRLEEFPAPDFVNFLVRGTGSTMFSLTVAAPSEKAGKVFGLESQKEIILYGRAVKLGLSGLTLVMEEVEEVEQTK